ncbi:MAG: carboxypeptidase regulatory-like domain-containing protein, partial [Muribaculaceae bacterium]|nr:carboxypeptidase regulatory-like domain-containing protein [Muribaculaceae bacterium]
MKNLIKILSLILMAVLPMTSCTEDPEDAFGTITGSVTQAPKGTEPLSGVTVTIVSTGQSTTTGSSGAFTFSNLTPGNYSLQFSKAGYTTNSRTVSVVAGNESKCDIQLSKEEEEAEILINPTSLNFGTTQTDMNVTIKNNGKATASWAIDLGNNTWLSVSQLAGSIQAGRTQSITFSVNRDYLSEPRSIILNLQAFGNSYPISISCAPRNATSNMVLEPQILDFGTIDTEKSITIRNTGNSALSWNISGITSSAVSATPTQGAVAPGGKSIVTVSLDREKISGSLSTFFIVSDGVKEEMITITANTSGGTSPDNPETPGTNTIVEKNSLYAYFPFNGNFDDLSENKIYAYGSPAPTFVADGVTPGTEAAKFIRKDKSAFIVNEGLIDSRTMSICFWAKNISDGSIFHVTSSLKNDGGEEMMSFAYKDGHFKYVITRYNNHYQYSGTGNFTHKTIEDESWHHIALVSDFNRTNYAKATTQLYIDGRLMDTVTEDIIPFTEAESSGANYGTGTKFILGGENV